MFISNKLRLRLILCEIMEIKISLLSIRMRALLPSQNVYRYPKSVNKLFMIPHKRDKGNQLGTLRYNIIIFIMLHIY